jgi:hypothetical protein
MPLMPCRECGEEVSGNAATCPSCGIKSPARKRLGLFTALAIAAALFVIFTNIAEKQSSGVEKPATKNPLNDHLLSLSPKGQAERLGKAVQLFGDACNGKTAFYQGSMDDRPHQDPFFRTHAAFWSVKCTNGASYQVEILPNGDGAIVECSIVEATYGHCFKKF